MFRSYFKAYFVLKEVNLANTNTEFLPYILKGKAVCYTLIDFQVGLSLIYLKVNTCLGTRINYKL